MGKRFLISILLILVIVAGIAVGATMVFSGHYETLAAETSAAAPELSLDSSPPPVEVSTIPTAEPNPNPEPEASDVETPAVTQAAPQISAPVPLDDAESILKDMTLKEKICQLLFVTPEALTGYGQVTKSGTATMDAIAEYPVGGVIYFSANLDYREQTQEMLANIQSYSIELTGRGLFLGVDEEGGSVARVADTLGTTKFEDMRIYGQEGDPDKAYEIGSTLASDLKALGFNVDFAPVADVLTNEDNTVVQDRSFGSDPELVSSMVAREVEGLLDGGVLCAPKHFPGHGSTGGDTHDGFASSDRTLEELEACDLLPFQAAIDAGAPMIMVGHMTMTEIDSENPASLSEKIVTGILREQMGYDGIVITDSMDMGAIADNYSVGEAVLKAIQAGCDMVLCVSDIDAAIDTVTQAVEEGTLTEADLDQHVLRILETKQKYGILN